MLFHNVYICGVPNVEGCIVSSREDARIPGCVNRVFASTAHLAKYTTIGAHPLETTTLLNGDVELSEDTRPFKSTKNNSTTFLTFDPL